MSHPIYIRPGDGSTDLKVRCPLCNHDNTFRVPAANLNGQRPVVVFCDDESGGCGADLAIRATLSADVQAAAITFTPPPGDSTMPNMSHCRFQNTLQDFQDCVSALTDTEQAPLKGKELEAAVDLFREAQDAINILHEATATDADEDITTRDLAATLSEPGCLG